MKKTYVKINSRINNGLFVSLDVYFIPKETINCFVPYVAGQKDHTWVTCRKGCIPKTKDQWEQKLGMSLMEYT